jgi:hypothetical protein
MRIYKESHLINGKQKKQQQKNVYHVFLFNDVK